MNTILHLDFETRSDVDLKKAGLHEYARGRNTDIMCAAYAFGDEAVQLWRPGGILPDRFIDHIESGGIVHAHNATFEQELCNNVAVRKYNWPYLYTDQLECTMAMSYAMGLPGHLGSTAAALGIAEQKDMVGHRLMLQYCQPKDVTGARISWWDNPEDLEKLFAYCRQDVEVERAIGKRLMRLSPYEQSIWQLDQKINSRGICVDVKGVMAATIIVEAEKLRLNEEMRKVTHNHVASCQAVQQIKDFLYLSGVQMAETLAAPDVVQALAQPDLLPVARRVLELRKEAGKASTAKLSPMLAGTASPPHRLRGCFQYSGANTRRWAGRRVQLHNLKRPTIKQRVIDQILDQLPKGMTAHEIDALYGSPLDVLSNCVRGFLVSAPGSDLLCCDFSSIEARVLAWLATETEALNIFNSHGRIYEHAASNIFGVGIDEVDESQRQVGKVAVLALGYQGGVGALQTMARGYGVRLEPVFGHLWGLADSDQRERAEFAFTSRRDVEISREEFIASDLTKQFWRAANPSIVRFWTDIGSAAIRAVQNPKQKFSVGNVSFLVNGSFLWCRLPSGGVICYPYPQVNKVDLPWGSKADALTYMAEEGQSKKWMRFKTYGGSIAENITQAVARDLLADAMLRLESRGWKIVAHVHDEIVCEMLEGEGSIEEMSRIMCQHPEWALGLPIKAGGWRGKRYRK